MASQHPVTQAVRQFLLHPEFRQRGWLTAVSGGPDSVALLHTLHALSGEYTFRLAAGHMNHLLRGPDSDADEAFVRDLCNTLQVPLHVDRIDVRKKSQESGLNLEALARQQRYAWLGQVAQTQGLDCIATGHHADDQAETVLHHLLRGTGLRGLRGISGTRHLENGLILARPLLNVTRNHILDYLSLHALAFRLDASNADTGFLRNRIRNELLPLLRERYHPAADAHLAQLAELAVQWQEYLGNEAVTWLRKVEKPRVGSLLILDATLLATLPPLMLREVLHCLGERENWPLGQMTQVLWRSAVEVATGARAAQDLPDGLRIARKKDIVQFGPKDGFA